MKTIEKSIYIFKDFDLDEINADIVYSHRPGMPAKENGYEKPNGMNGMRVRSVHDIDYGWIDESNNVWVPHFSECYSKPCWNVQRSDGSFQNVYPKKTSVISGITDSGPKLICKKIKFYSKNDGDTFFEHIKKIRCIGKIELIRDSLQLYIVSNAIHRCDMYDLFGLFNRYKINKEQLRVVSSKKIDFFFKE